MFPFDLEESADHNPQPRRKRLWLREGKKCHWCSCETTISKLPSEDQATIDHVVPRHKGGTDTEENLVSACYRCNQRRNKEDQLSLPEGALLKTFRIRALTAEKPKRSQRLEEQRDQALAEVMRLRTELELAQTGWKAAQSLRDDAFEQMERMRQQMEQMTFRRLLLLKLKRWVTQYV